jgi:hypothetical protein
MAAYMEIRGKGRSHAAYQTPYEIREPVRSNESYPYSILHRCALRSVSRDTR